MTRDEIMNMPAGREMDRLIAEKIMGLSVYDGERKIVRYEGFHGQRKRTYTIPEIYVRISGVANYSCDSYSIDIKQAWSVIEKLEQHTDEILFKITRLGATMEKLQWMAEFRECRGRQKHHVSEAETAPLAICRAALMAVEAV